jgi:hypothetical protein
VRLLSDPSATTRLAGTQEPIYQLRRFASDIGGTVPVRRDSSEGAFGFALPARSCPTFAQTPRACRDEYPSPGARRGLACPCVAATSHPYSHPTPPRYIATKSSRYRMLFWASKVPRCFPRKLFKLKQSQKPRSHAAFLNIATRQFRYLRALAHQLISADAETLPNASDAAMWPPGGRGSLPGQRRSSAHRR